MLGTKPTRRATATKWRRSGRVVLTLGLALFLSTASERAAKADSLGIGSDDDWEFVAASYAWFTALHGKATVSGQEAPVNASFGDIFSETNIAFMGQFEVRKGRVGVFVNPVYVGLDSTNAVGASGGRGQSTQQPEASVSSQLFTTDIGLSYRVMDVIMDGGRAAGGSRAVVEPYLAARVWNLSSQVEIPLSRRTLGGSDSKTWADAVFGLRTRWDFGEHWNVTALADVGGGPVGASSITAQGMLLAGYRFEIFEGGDAKVTAGYRALYDNYTTGSGQDQFSYNATLHGPVLGLSLRF
ncbi:MAG: hypothetical protein Kilf2KO_10110 [Rhodospirillales bacterium]